MKAVKHWTFWAVLAGASLGASAQNGPQSGGSPPGPPPEAVAACKGKTEGTKVQFTGHRGEQVSGVCRKMGDVLAAFPDGPPPDQHK